MTKPRYSRLGHVVRAEKVRGVWYARVGSATVAARLRRDAEAEACRLSNARDRTYTESRAILGSYMALACWAQGLRPLIVSMASRSAPEIVPELRAALEA